MTIQPKTTVEVRLPDSAPFSSEQRDWLSGFFTGVFSAEFVAAQGVATPDTPLVPEGLEDDAPWKDASMPLADRQKLAEGKPLPRQLYAAMAQQDCGQCGYLCETYAKALAEGVEARQNLCVPGGKDTLRAVRALLEQTGARPAAPAIPPPNRTEPPRGTSRDNPAQTRFLSRRRLNKQESAKDTWHVEFDLADSGLSYTAGDSFGVFAQNNAALVDAIIGQLGARPDGLIGGKPLRNLLIEDVALGPAPDQLFQLFSYVAGGELRTKAKLLAEGQDPDGDLERLDVLGALVKFAKAKPSADAFVETLEPLQPRLYSISSSPRVSPHLLTLTVDAVRYSVANRPRQGVASTWLADRISPGTEFRAYVQAAHAFGLPSDPALPLIMIGPGTGIAPHRAFLQDRAASGASGRNWLFYGHQRSAADFFYEDELNDLKKRGVLTRLSLAWSRDGAEKIYVQDRLREKAAEIAEWINEGAHIRVCGDAKRMAKDVERAFVDIIAERMGLSSDQAIAYVAALKKSGRYQADVY
jgi:sulfite reductase (NADPH) flavoprotein alpha-component